MPDIGSVDLLGERVFDGVDEAAGSVRSASCFVEPFVFAEVCGVLVVGGGELMTECAESLRVGERGVDPDSVIMPVPDTAQAVGEWMVEDTEASRVGLVVEVLECQLEGAHSSGVSLSARLFGSWLAARLAQSAGNSGSGVRRVETGGRAIFISSIASL